MVYEKLSKAELAQRLDALQVKLRSLNDAGETQHLLHELQVHQIELEMQNRALQEAQRQLEESRDRYTELYDGAPVGYLTLNERGQILQINLTGAAMLGRDRAYLLNQPIAAFMHPMERRSLSTYLRQVLQFQQKVVRMMHIKILDGSALDVRLEGIAVADHLTGQRTARIALIDVSEIKQAEGMLRLKADQLTLADQRKNEFLALLAHELRNPLAPIYNAVQVLKLQSNQPAGARLEWAVEVIERQLQQLTRLVGDLLDVARITRGRIKLQRAMVDVGEVMHRAAELAGPLVESRRHRLRIETPEPPVQLHADTVRLTQAIGNLLNNAARYTEPGGQIWLSATRAGEKLTITVRDTGAGIPSEVLPHIFEPFMQTERPLDRAAGGLGLGLTLVRDLVVLHGGHVEAQSPGLGQGSNFLIHLPITPHVENLDVPPRPARYTGCGRRILLVDDNKDVAESLATLLTDLGHEVRVSYHGAAAIEVARGFEPEVAFLDIGLPEMSGYELARRLRKELRNNQLFLVALTGYGQDEAMRNAREAGFDAFVPKPGDLTVLEELLTSFAGRDHATSQQAP